MGLEQFKAFHFILTGSHFQVKMMMPPGGVSVSYEALIIIVCMSISSLMLLFSIGAIVYVMHKR